MWRTTLVFMCSDSPPIAWTALVLAGGAVLDSATMTKPRSPSAERPRPITSLLASRTGPRRGRRSRIPTRLPATALLAVDMRWAGELAEYLVAGFASCGAAARVPVAGSGFRQSLCAVVRTAAVHAALRELGDPHGRSLSDLMSFVDVGEPPLHEAEMRWVDDFDTRTTCAGHDQRGPHLGWRHSYPEPMSPPPMNKEQSP